MSCKKTECKFHKEGEINNCKRNPFRSDKCVHHAHNPLFQLKPTSIEKQEKNTTRKDIYCHGCSESSASGMAVYHLPPACCDCEPFQSCEICRTTWLPIKDMSKNDVEYYLLDKNNTVGVGRLEGDRFIIYNPEKTPNSFSAPVMFAEIKA